MNTKFAEKTADLIEDATQNADKNAPFTLYSPIYQQRVMALGHAGQVGVGVHSNWVVFNSLIQQVSSEDNPIQLIGIDEEGGRRSCEEEVEVDSFDFEVDEPEID